MAASTPKKLKAVPAKDIRWVSYIDNDHCEWLVTSKPDRSVYFLYRRTSDGYELMKKAATPADFDSVVYPPEKPTKKQKR